MIVSKSKGLGNLGLARCSATGSLTGLINPISASEKKGCSPLSPVESSSELMEVEGEMKVGEGP